MTGITSNIKKRLSAMVSTAVKLNFRYKQNSVIHAYYETGGCDGTTKNPGIIKAPPDYYQADEGSDAILQWTYCKTPEGSITGLIISREERRRSYLLGIHVSGKIVYYQAARGHYNITWMKEHGLVTFIMKNITMGHAGHYNLVIRRVGYADLESKFNVVVRKAGLVLIRFCVPYNTYMLLTEQVIWSGGY